MSSPRVAWMFHVYGYKNISILNGGLPLWHKNGYPVLSNNIYKNVEGIDYINGDETSEVEYNIMSEQSNIYSDEALTYDKNIICNYEEIENIMNNKDKNKNIQIIDLRPTGRFTGIEPEPRPIPSGELTNAINIPSKLFLEEKKYMRNVNTLPKLTSEMEKHKIYMHNSHNTCDVNQQEKTNIDNLYTQYTYYTLKSSNDILKLLKKYKFDFNSEKSIFSCGSGTTACIGYLSLYINEIANHQLIVYDGSYTEWKTRKMREIT